MSLIGLQRVGFFLQVIEVGADAAVQDAAQVAQGHELGGEQVVAVVLDEVDAAGPSPCRW